MPGDGGRRRRPTEGEGGVLDLDGFLLCSSTNVPSLDVMLSDREGAADVGFELRVEVRVDSFESSSNFSRLVLKLFL